ncbi:LysR family transcriptional regulator for metE and metH [Vibrio crassostreae]|uniref:LysR substrate-binding domain-containing protein n=1 Tax=Vibrio crassostreae TaxID=246167 RepID=UPI000F46D791|nr:LysR substrate-binding domain-containing protein [Vibrio crassostreae]ROO67339.1 LysR family transcriptional regulator for metE and metH [Vibrio crassostreae]ROP13300.1 LysR family transcriptional regulator for metE and metH [Vibrio crassostreae]ROQ87375.1 LysR family transcriptional regulator for metE and metH [Vibrio crassostreae]ROR88254.1 LysR family transcriptional regulator for metE and metH [Vibrio crassostreae]RPE90172.1 LysR family transcriptional regulator for metE and metH [Vibri
MIELKHLRTLTTLRDSSSLTATATSLHLTQSALSHQLKDLEARIGGQLFLRKTRPVKFTSEGEILLKLADEIQPRIAKAENELASLKEDVNGRLHMAIECHSCFQWLMPALKEYQVAWPSVTLDFSSGFGFEPLPALMAGELDLVITSDIQPRSEVHYEPLFDFEMRLITAINSPLADKASIDPQDLSDLTMLSYPVQKQRLDVVKHFLQPAGVEPKKWKQADNTLMLVQMVSAGLGVAALPNWAISEFSRQGLIASKPLGKGLSRRLFAAVRNSEKDKRYLQAFFSTARQQSKSHLDGIEVV